MNSDRAPSGNHGALMDRTYRHQRHIYDLTRKYYLVGRDRLVRELSLKPGQRLVEVGCGTARNLIAIARRYPNVRLYGLDASGEMLKTAGEAVSRAGLTERISLVQGFAEELTPDLFGSPGPVDHCVFSYSLSMIPEWRTALSAARGALAPTGFVHVVDFGDFRGLWRPARTILRKWLSLFHVQPRAEILETIERQAEFSSDLWVSPGRYALVWHSGGKRLSYLALADVAAGSQAPRNPRQGVLGSASTMDIPSPHQPNWAQIRAPRRWAGFPASRRHLAGV